MIILDTALKRRAADGRPIRVGMIGAGFMGSGIALQIAQAMPGMRLAAVAARRPERALDAFAQTMDRADIVRAANQREIEDAVAAGRPVVTEDHVGLASADGIDAVIEVTGSIEYALAGIEAAIAARKHVIVMNAELDATIGPILKEKADRAGVVFSNADGDQPGVQMNLYRYVRSLGVTPVLCGNIKGLQDTARTPDTQRGFAERWGQNVHMVTSFADGTKVNFEQAVVANATGMRVARRGMIGPDPTGKDPYQPLRPIEDYVSAFEPHLAEGGPGLVDYIVGGRPGPGVFVLGRHDDPRQRHYLELYKLGAGPYYVFYSPYHLCHFEAPLSLARAVLFHDAAAAPLGVCVGVAATAKRDLKPGDILDGIGAFDAYGEAENADVMVRENLLPMGLAEGCRMKVAVKRGQTLRFDDVETPPGRRADALYAEQMRRFTQEGNAGART